MSRFTTKVDLLADVDAVGSSAAVTVDQGGRFLFIGQGTFDGTTLKLQLLGPDGTNYVDVPDASLTAAGAKSCFLPDNAVIRADLGGGDTPTVEGIYATLRRCPEC